MTHSTRTADHAADTLHSTVDILSLRLNVRDDLSISLQSYGGRTCYLIEDPLTSRFYRVGVSEYTLLSLMDGDLTIAEAMGKTAELTGQEAISESDTIAFCKWLVDSQLAFTPQSTSAGRLAESAQSTRRQKLASSFGPIFQKVPLSRPNNFVEHFKPLARLIFSRWGALIWLVVLAIGSSALWLRWDEYLDSHSSILSPHNWMHLAGAWVVLKLIHESAHALACKRYEGDVSEAGVMLVLLAPLPYVDVTSAWRFDSKWKRIVVSAAGMFAELFVAAIAAWLWTRTDSALIRQTAQNMILTATVMTLAFNANPLMRFDGYYILSDWLELPNLATHGQQWVRYHLGRLFFGDPPMRPTWPEHRTRLIATYGILAIVWRVVICISLVIVAEAMFFGAGVVIALLATATWLVTPLASFITKIYNHPNGRSKVRAFAVLATMCTIGICVWKLVPYYDRVSAPAVVDYWPLTEVRSSVEGFVKKVNVFQGQFVAGGELLVELENPELELEAQRLRVELDKAQQRIRYYRSNEQLPALQVEQRNQQALKARLRKVEQELTDMQIRAEHAGRVIDLPLRWKKGTLVTPGTPLVGLGGYGQMHLQVMVPQHDLKAFKKQVSQPIEAHVWGWGRTEATLKQVNPRASTDLLHPALAAFARGPLEVRVKDATEVNSSKPDQWELIQPHFLAVATSPSTKLLHPGQTGFVSFWQYEGTLGRVLLYRFARWTENRRNLAKQAWRQN